MDLQTEPSEEVQHLRRCMNDLVSLLALPAIWSGGDASQISRTLLDVLLATLRIDFVYVRLNDPGGGQRIEMARVNQPLEQTTQSQEIGQALDRLLGDAASAWAPNARMRIGETEYSAASARLGLRAEIGILVAGSHRAEFPTETERLLLNVAANQAVTGLEEARLLGEQKRIARELDERVAQRTSELAAANEALMQEVTERRRAEEALRDREEALWASERNLKLIVDTIPALAWSARPDGSAEFLNQHYLDFVGLSVEQAQGWGWTVTVHPDDLNGLIAAWQAMMASGAPGEAEARLRRFDGEYRWLLFRTNPLHNASGSIVKWYGVNTDIDDRRRAETDLAREKSLLEMIASGSPVRDVLGALCTMVEEAAQGCYCDVHPIDWSGPTIEYSVAPSLPASYTQPIAGLSISGDTLPCAIAARQKIQVVAEDMESDSRWRDSNVRTHVLEHGLRAVWSTPICAKDGYVLGTLCLYQHQPGSPSPRHQSLIAHATHLASIAIERSRTEVALRRSEAFLAEGQHLARMGNFSWSLATGEIRWSEQLYRIFEFEPGDPVTVELIARRFHPEDMPLLADMMEQAKRGEADFEYQHRIVLPDQSIKHLHLIAHRSRDDPGQREYIGTVLDISQRRLADEALIKTRSELAHITRVTSLGALTASIAHEVNQPLSGIITNASTCLRMLAADPPNIDGAQETARRTIRDGNRAADVIARLRALFSKRTTAIEAVDLNDAVREVIALLSTDLQRTRVVLHTELADGLHRVGGDRVQLQQVIMNLLRNASDAMSDIDDRPRRLLIRTEPDGGDHVRLSVRDAGVGFGPEGTERLFEAFYTTKSEGMGIGLSVSRSIIEKHNGRLWAHANDGPGVTFSFSIPEYSGDVSAVHEIGPAQAPVASNAQSAAGPS